MIRLHAAAVLALIDAQPNVTVYDGQVPNRPVLPYAVMYADQGGAGQSAFSGKSDFRVWRFQTTAVGSTPEQCRWLAERVELALLDVAPVVTGRTCGRIDKLDSQPVRRDDTVDPALFYAVDRWQFLSVAA